MPTYVYRREDGTKFEIKQRITEDPLEKCPETGQPVERIIAGSAGLIFKGDGFYVNDYAESNGSKRNGSSATAAAEESSSSEAAASEPTASGSGSDNAASSGEAASDSANSSSDA